MFLNVQIIGVIIRSSQWEGVFHLALLSTLVSVTFGYTAGTEANRALFRLRAAPACLASDKPMQELLPPTRLDLEGLFDLECGHRVGFA